VECELFAIYERLRILGEYDCRAVWLFSDCVAALRCIDNMRPDDVMAGLWEIMVPPFTRFEKVWLALVPAHRNVTSNERADWCAQHLVGTTLNPARWGNLGYFGSCYDSKGKDIRTSEWWEWHLKEGHTHYKKGPS